MPNWLKLKFVTFLIEFSQKYFEMKFVSCVNVHHHQLNACVHSQPHVYKTVDR